MTVRRSKGCACDGDRGEICSDWLPAVTSMHAHVHMPRFRNTLSPRLASAGKTSPNMAERITSYCATTAGESVGGLASALVIPPFFLHRRHVRSFLDAHRDQIHCEPGLPVPVPESALRGQAVS